MLQSSGSVVTAEVIIIPDDMLAGSAMLIGYRVRISFDNGDYLILRRAEVVELARQLITAEFQMVIRDE